MAINIWVDRTAHNDQKHSWLSSPIRATHSFEALKSIYRLTDIKLLTSAVSLQWVSFTDINVTYTTHLWFITSVPNIKYLPTTGLKPKFKAVRCWNDTHLKVAFLCFEALFKRLPSNTDDTTQWYVLLISAALSQSPPAEGLNPAQQPSASQQGSTEPPPLTPPTLLAPSVLLFKLTTRRIASSMELSAKFVRNVNDVGDSTH